MATIENLNREYEQLKANVQTLEKSREKISFEQNNFSLSPNSRFTNCMAIVDVLNSEMNCAGFTYLSDAITIGILYRNCLNAIASYKGALLSLSTTGNKGSLVSATTAMKAEQANFDSANQRLVEKYHSGIDSADTLINFLLKSFDVEIDGIRKRISQILSDAKAINDKEYSIELRKENALAPAQKLPADILIARTPISKNVLSVLRDIGVTETYQNIFGHLQGQGNVLVESSFEHRNDEAMDSFIIAYILRFIELFPLGAVNVHIFDKNANYLYRRLSSAFQNDQAGQAAKKVIQLHSDISDLTQLKNVVCEDVFKKTSVSKPDLYAVYEDDQTDAFNLIVLRNGFIESNGYVAGEILDTINSLTKPGDIGHRCGFRFLIVDDSKSFEKSISSTSKFIVESIRKNCALLLAYSNGKFSCNGKAVEVLRIVENMDNYIQERSASIAETVSTKEKAIVSLDDVGSGSVVELSSSILNIPVGKAGADVLSLPLSCKDESGTLAGGCIGYIAIGQSGSGKSAFFHSVVLNGCMKYSPRDLQFWLLDFKYGGASSKYRDSGLPHIRIVAENNKIDDALCLFQMIFEEMERRYKAFNQQHVNDILDYNRLAANNSRLEYFPRIIIAIDEVQEIFREDNASVLQKLISSIAVRMRAAGMHFVMVAQNLCDGKAYMLKDAFLTHVSGRICFRVAADVPRESGFEDDYIQRKQEISELKTGEAYMSYGKGTIKKVKVAYVSPQDMTAKYFPSIKSKYSEYSNMKPLVIGSKQRLSITSLLQGKQTTYLSVLQNEKCVNGTYSALIGEDAYRMTPLHLQFSQYENSSVLLLGSDKQLASSLCASITSSLLRQRVIVHLFNGDRARIRYDADSVAHPFMYVCQNIQSQYVQNHRLDQLKNVLKDLYAEYLERQDLVQKADDEDPEFPAVFLIINDLLGIESFNNNIMIESEIDASRAVSSEGFNLDYDIFSNTASNGDNNAGFRENIQTILNTLLKNGYRYNMHLIVAVRGDTSSWRNSHSATETCNSILFNSTEYADQFENSYYLKEMLRNIANEGSGETMAVWSYKKTYSKVRPFVYNMADSQERSVLESLVKGE